MSQLSESAWRNFLFHSLWFCPDLNWLDEAHPRWGKAIGYWQLIELRALILSRNTLTGAFRMMFDRMLWHHVAQSTWLTWNQPLRRHLRVRERALRAERAADAKALGWALEGPGRGRQETRAHRQGGGEGPSVQWEGGTCGPWEGLVFKGPLYAQLALF